MGAEVYASASEQKIVYHTCKSPFCPSCGARSAAVWQEEIAAILPQIPYIEINFTMPPVFWPLLQRNRHLLSDLPALGAPAFESWANARYGARAILMRVHADLRRVSEPLPHLHTLVSAGGLTDSPPVQARRASIDGATDRGLSSRRRCTVSQLPQGPIEQPQDPSQSPNRLFL